MRSRDMLMREASEYYAYKHSPKPDYSEFGWPAFLILATSGVVVGAFLVTRGEFVRAWCYSFLLVFAGISVLVTSKHPMKNYERADIDIWWPVTDRAYGSLAYEHEELWLFMIAAYWIGFAILMRVT